jgi:protein-S-isoprenylcysteine O-methyltransferase Ste14
MTDDQVFRLVLILGSVGVLPVGIYHRIRSQASGERLDRRQEGLFILATLRPLGLATMAGLVAFVINPEWMRWSQVALPSWVRWLGVGLGTCAGALLVWVFRSLGDNITDTVVTRRRHTLVTHGPYRWVRHPLYTATAMAVTANALVTANWALALGGASTFGLLVLRTGIEERKLLERFGSDYAEYMGRTGRFLPRRIARRC